MKHEYDLKAEKQILDSLEEPWKYARLFTCYCENEKNEVLDLYYETREKLLALFSKYKDGDEGAVKLARRGLSWSVLAENAMGKGFGDTDLAAYNNARQQVAEMCDIDLEKSECPEDEIEDACREHAIVFDGNGNISFYISSRRADK